MGRMLIRLVIALALSVPVALTLLRMHLDPNPIFGERPTWREVVARYAGGGDGTYLKGKTVVLTGGTDGIGVETAKAFVYLGAHLILGARNLDKANSVVRHIQEDVGKDRGTIEVRLLDASSMQSVSEFASSIKVPVDILVLNAGTMNVGEFITTPEGFEQMFATNYLGAAFLTLKLLDRLASAAPISRVVYVASYGPYISATSREKLTMSDFEWTPQKLSTRLPLLGPMEMYANSKVAGMLFFRELARRQKASGIKTYIAHPGMMATSIGQDRPVPNESLREKALRLLKGIGQNIFMNSLPGLKSVSEGAATQVFCATAPDLEAHSGRYYADVQESQSTAATRDDVLAVELYEWTVKQVSRF